MNLRLIDGSRVCIIGGGPAGSFSALHLLSLARQSGITLDVTIFEPRNFDLPGPGGCNWCAGILSSRLLKGLDDLGITLPDEVIQAELDSYTVYVGDRLTANPPFVANRSGFRVTSPDTQRRIVSVYRGGGPRKLAGGQVAGLDSFLLKQAALRGACHLRERVRTVIWEAERPVIITFRERYPCDLVVLATGVNSRAPLDARFGYTAPKTAVMAQDEFLRPDDWPVNEVRAYFHQPEGLVFGAVIPKGRYVNVSLLGNGMTKDTVNDFVDAQNLDSLGTSSSGSLCGCNPRVAVSTARRYFGDRWVAVGDAAVTRLYKDGIGSAFYAAQSAMRAALEQGISRHAFRAGYAPYCRGVEADNFYGRLLFFFWGMVLQNPLLLTAWEGAVRTELAQSHLPRQYIRILWGMFTGDELYKTMFRMAISLPALKKLFEHRPNWLVRR